MKPASKRGIIPIEVTQMSERLLTPEEVAARLAVSPKSIREWLRSRKLKGVKAGRLWRVKEDEIEAFLVVPAKLRQPRTATALRGAERAEFIRALKGKYASTGHVVEDFLREKRAETEREDKQQEERRKR